MVVLPILLLLIEINFLNSAAINDSDTNTDANSFYFALEQKCPSLKNFHNFTHQNIFTNCKNWKEIQQIKNLTKETEQSVRCLLYFDSFVYFCDELVRQNVLSIPNPLQYLLPDLKNYTVDKVCKNLALFPVNKTFEHPMLKSIINEQHCVKLCDSYTDTPVTECSLAHYFANFDVAQFKKGSSQDMVQQETKLIDAQSSNASEVGSKSAGNVDIFKHILNTTIPETSPKKTQAETVQSGADTIVDTNNSQSQLVGKNTSVGGNDASKLLQEAHEKPQTNQDKVEEHKQNESQVKPSTKNNPVQTTVINEKTTLGKQGDQVVSPAKDAGKDVANKDTANEEVNMKEEVAGETNDEFKEMNSEEDVDQEEEPKLLDDDPNLQDKIELPETQDNIKEPETQHKVEVPETQKNVAPQQDMSKEKLDSIGTIPINDSTFEDMDGESYFFSYFMVICVLFVLGYVGYHNRQKVIALVLEGKQGKRRYRGRRPNSANYHKLDSNLEEAISSSCTKSTTHIIY